jgi:hypothetical protein
MSVYPELIGESNYFEPMLTLRLSFEIYVKKIIYRKSSIMINHLTV